MSSANGAGLRCVTAARKDHFCSLVAARGNYLGVCARLLVAEMAKCLFQTCL